MPEYPLKQKEKKFLYRKEIATSNPPKSSKRGAAACMREAGSMQRGANVSFLIIDGCHLNDGMSQDSLKRNSRKAIVSRNKNSLKNRSEK